MSSIYFLYRCTWDPQEVAVFEVKKINQSINKYLSGNDHSVIIFSKKIGNYKVLRYLQLSLKADRIFGLIRNPLAK